MRSLCALAILLALPGADAARAGAWLREEGKGFAAGSVTLSDSKTTTNAYLEYGLRPRKTVGLDLESDSSGVEGYATAFVVRPLGPAGQTARLSWTLGAGLDWCPVAAEPFLKGGVSWGRGITWGARSGWATVDGTVKWSLGDAPTTTKIDSTLGLGLTDRLQAMMQLFVTFEGGDTTAKLAPSLLYTPKSGAFTVQFGAEVPTTGAGDPALKIGLWRNF